jgi:NTP pyrophosphatase (non-canonical NTP hydrolase)
MRIDHSPNRKYNVGGQRYVVAARRMVDMEEQSVMQKLLAVTQGYRQRFPAGDDPFQMMTRLLEECGELAQQVNHFEGSGVKREKYGEPDRARLAKEVQNVLTCALQIALYYGVEQELADSLERSYRRLKAEGFIEEECR